MTRNRLPRWWALALLLLPALALAGCTGSPPSDAGPGSASGAGDGEGPGDGGAGTGTGDSGTGDGDGMAGGDGMTGKDGMEDGAGGSTGGGMDPHDAPKATPLPATAKGPAIDPSKGYLVEEIRDGLYYVTEGTYQMMFLTTGEGVIVVDAPPTIGERIPLAIAEVTSEPITHVIYSHSHADHIAAAHLYPIDATYIAHEATAEALRTQQSPDRLVPYGTFVGGAPVPVPGVTFTDNYTLTVGNQTLVLYDLGPAHEPGNLFIHAPAHKVLMLVDVIFPGWVPFLELAQAEDVPAFYKAHDQVLAFDFDTFLGGHLTRLGTRQDVEVQREYMQDVRNHSAQALQSVDFMAIAQETGFENLWLLFGTYLDAVADECNRLTVAKWDGKLGGADLFTKSHCESVLESLRID